MIRGAVRHLFLARLPVSRESLFVKSGAADFAVAGLVTKPEVGLAKINAFFDRVVWICFYNLWCRFGCFSFYGLHRLLTLSRTGPSVALWETVVDGVDLVFAVSIDEIRDVIDGADLRAWGLVDRFSVSVEVLVSQFNSFGAICVFDFVMDGPSDVCW